MIEFIGHIIKELSLGSFVSAWVMIGSVKVFGLLRSLLFGGAGQMDGLDVGWGAMVIRVFWAMRGCHPTGPGLIAVAVC